MGRARRRERGEGRRPLGPGHAGEEKKKEGRPWAGPRGKKRKEKKEKEFGPAQVGKREGKECNSNVFEFEFEI
jgi:hypothetical protein